MGHGSERFFFSVPNDMIKYGHAREKLRSGKRKGYTVFFYWRGFLIRSPTTTLSKIVGTWSFDSDNSQWMTNKCSQFGLGVRVHDGVVT